MPTSIAWPDNNIKAAIISGVTGQGTKIEKKEKFSTKLAKIRKKKVSSRFKFKFELTQASQYHWNFQSNVFASLNKCVNGN